MGGAGLPRVVGVDLAAGRGITALATLAVASPPRLVSLSYPDTDEAIVEEAVRQFPAVIAVDAPLTLPGALAAAFAGSAWGGHSSLYTRAAERDPLWRAIGVRPLPVSFLSGLTTRAIPLAQRLRAAVPGCVVIEVFPTASLRALGVHPHNGGARSKSAQGARRDAQRELGRRIAGLDDLGAGEPLSADALDALAAALTAVAFVRSATVSAGDPAEGCIIVLDAARFAALSI